MDCIDRTWESPKVGPRNSFAAGPPPAELQVLHMRLNVLEGKLYEDLKSHAEHVHEKLERQHRSMISLGVQVESIKQAQSAPARKTLDAVELELPKLPARQAPSASHHLGSAWDFAFVETVPDLAGAPLTGPAALGKQDAAGPGSSSVDSGPLVQSVSSTQQDTASAGAAISCGSLCSEDVEDAIKALREQHDHLLQEHLRLEQLTGLLENRLAQQEEAHRELERSGFRCAEESESFRAQIDARIESVLVMGANQAAEFNRISAQLMPLSESPRLLQNPNAAADSAKDPKASLRAEEDEDPCITEVWDYRLNHHHSMSFLGSARASRQVVTPEQESDWDSCGWQCSIWDAAFFLGTPQLSPAGSVFMLWLLVVNIVIQVTYTYIVADNLTQPFFTAELVDGFSSWRARMTASQFFDPALNMSLAERVCSEDPSLEMSTQQANVIADINEYKADGPLMCVLAICIWVNACARELHRISRQWRSMLLVPRSKTNGTRIVELDTEATLWRLESVSSSRLAFFMSTLVCRLCICVWLLVNGVQFLVRTVSLADLLMNAIALEFVLNIDEMLFASLAPFNTVRLLGAMERLPFQHKYHWSGVDLVSFLMAMLTVTVVLISIPVWLMPSIATLDATLNALCGSE